VVLGIELPGVQPRTVRVHATGEGGQAVEVVLGTARLHGTVWDGARLPAARVKVEVSSFLRQGPKGWTASAPGAEFSVRTTTDAEGRYELGDLPAGRYVLVATPAPDASDPRNIRSFEVELADGESRRLDVGAPMADATWSGVVRFSDGEAVRAAGSVFLEDPSQGRRLYVSFDAEGRFAQEIPAGAWTTRFFVFPRRDPAAALGAPVAMTLVPSEQPVEMNDLPRVGDLVLPGARLAGRLEASRTSVHLKEVDGTRIVPVAVAEDLTLSAPVVPPGSWTVVGAPTAVRFRYGERLEVAVDASRVEVVLEASAE
jgi:hypothetical protein